MLDALLIEAEKKRRMEFFNSCATSIQRIWRGYRSRKLDQESLLRPEGLINNFYVRKRILADIARKNAEFIASTKPTAEERLREEEESMKEAERKFKEEASHLHFLVSTEAKPGVFSASPPSPRSRRKACPIIVESVPLEDQIRSAAKAKVTHEQSTTTTAATTTVEPTTSELPPITKTSTSRKPTSPGMKTKHIETLQSQQQQQQSKPSPSPSSSVKTTSTQKQQRAKDFVKGEVH